MNDTRPADWKNYEDFAVGSAANRLPPTDALVGKNLKITVKSGQVMELAFTAKHDVAWAARGNSGADWYEAIEAAPGVYFIDMTFALLPKETLTCVVNLRTRRALVVRTFVRDEKVAGEPLVAQEFESAILGDATVAPTAMEPAPTRDLIGLTAHYTYSPNNIYQHIYLSSERYCWQCLKGVQRGHGDVDLATTYKFDNDLYLFTFREFLIPVASLFFYNFKDLRSTGKFLGVTGKGAIENKPAGAFIEKVSVSFYAPGLAPV
jgi:hypothetical protein